MADLPDFVKRFETGALLLVKEGKVVEPSFSRGTYHIEVQDPKEPAFSFLQMKDDGSLIDSFCDCKESEEGHGCIHLAASWLRIFNGEKEPLHVRFRKSFWNKLFQLEAKRNGFDPSSLTCREDGSFVPSAKGASFSLEIRPKNEGARKKLKELIFEREEETEETSIKFSNLSDEEISLYRKGQAGHLLRYELSFWSDLAKWFMCLQDEKKEYQVKFEGDPLPNQMHLDFTEVSLSVSIPSVNLPWIIPSLPTIESPLRVLGEGTSAVKNVAYDPEKKVLILEYTKENSLPEGPKIGEWIYVKDEGFYREKKALIFKKNRLEGAEIANALTESREELKPFLQIQSDPIEVQYNLYFDEKRNFHVELYLFEKGDLQKKNSAVFFPWVYVEERGFFCLKEWKFDQVQTVILQEHVSEFVHEHRLWLNEFSAFQTHMGSLESQLTYKLTRDESLVFDIELSFPKDEIFDFTGWFYVVGSGFYMKRSSSKFPLHPGQVVRKEEIASFIKNHTDELEQVQNFFAVNCPIEKMGLVIAVGDDGLIETDIRTEYQSSIDPKSLRVYGNYVYVEGQGFSEIESSLRIPEKYQSKSVIPASQESAFLQFELENLKACTIELDPRLKRPKKLELKIRKITADSRSRQKGWLVDFVYESELGFTDVFTIWDGFFEKKPHVFTNAGLLFLKEPRFQWIKQLAKKRLSRRRGLIRLNSLEWIRLSSFEGIKPVDEKNPTAIATKKLLKELTSFESDRYFDLTGLKSTLRPYQEEGVRWLWFLYCHGLSGLLSDDMGLGKTHQAMALLAAIFNTDGQRQNKYLVVCPTSVIYHWQDLLKRFLPHVRVIVYYGVSRSLEGFEEDYDLLLTSYGVLRQSRETIRSFSFEAAFFDEIQVAKNYASQTHKALKSIRSKMLLGMTGTPIENRLREMKALFDVILPSYMPSDAAFRDLFVNPIEKEGDMEKAKLLSKMVRPFILRRKKSEVLKDLPEKIEEIAYADLSIDQKTLYEGVAEQVRETVYTDLKNEEKPVSYIHVFSALSKFKQICNHPALIEGNLKDWESLSSGKWELFVELLKEARASNQKVVIFSQYIKMLEIIEMYLKKKKIGYASIKGSTRDRNEQLRKFREDPKCEVFVASLLAAGVGIDLTVASIVIHYDRWWNPAKENQATDRVHRLGQNRGVQVFKLVTKNTIEERIHSLIEKKKGLVDDVLGAEDQISYLSREELLDVFERLYSEEGAIE